MTVQRLFVLLWLLISVLHFACCVSPPTAQKMTPFTSTMMILMSGRGYCRYRLVVSQRCLKQPRDGPGKLLYRMVGEHAVAAAAGCFGLALLLLLLVWGGLLPLGLLLLPLAVLVLLFGVPQSL